eukprot:3789093-Prymnesium_polylepis.1
MSVGVGVGGGLVGRPAPCRRPEHFAALRAAEGRSTRRKARWRRSEERCRFAAQSCCGTSQRC